MKLINPKIIYLLFACFLSTIVNGQVTSKVAASYYHSLRLCEDGIVWSWGRNDYGQLGDGTILNSRNPVAVQNLSGGVVDIASGLFHSISLKSDGTVWAWGYNSNGQLGNGTNIDSKTPVKVLGLSGITAISSGQSHCIALKNDGTVWSWGRNYSGQLGDATMNDKNIPVQVKNLAGIIAIESGPDFSLALKSDGTVWAWGSNSNSRLGDGTTSSSKSTPVQVKNLAGITAVSAGVSLSMALKSDGTVWIWGRNDYGQLGDGSTIHQGLPFQNPNLSEVSFIAAGSDHAHVIKNDGTVLAWGRNNYGQLGVNSVTDQWIPVLVNNSEGIRSIDCGERYSIALKQDGIVMVWGNNGYGQLGDGTIDNQLVPVVIQRMTGVEDIEAGAEHALALTKDSNVWAWGQDYTSIPALMPEIPNVKKLSSGVNFTLALKNDSTVWAWGSSYGLGDGSVNRRNVPAPIPTLSGIIQVSAGDRFAAALKKDGTVWTWGENVAGELGDGTIIPKYIPIQVPNLAGVKSISSGGGHILALKHDGSVWAWGSNQYGQIGDGSNGMNAVQRVPYLVKVSAGVVAVSAGESFSLFLMYDGTVLACGRNAYGQLGDGSTVNRFLPVTVRNLTGIGSIEAGSLHSLAKRNDGTIWAWGRNYSGQLGDGTTIDRTLPVQTLNVGGVNKFSAAGLYSLFLKNDGSVWSCGSNGYKQLGNGDGVLLNSSTVVLINPLIPNCFKVCETLPTVDAGSDQIICSGKTVDIAAIGSGNLSWSPATGLNTSSGNLVKASPAATTKYIVTAVLSGGCYATDQITVTVLPKPTVNAGQDKVVCSGVPTSLTVSGTATEYSWSPARDLNTTTGTTVISTPSGGITYIVTGTDANGCTNTDDVKLQTFQSPVINTDGNKNICEGESVRLTASGGYYYSWSPATGIANPSLASITVQPTTTTTYTVTGTNQLQCGATAQVVVTVNAAPVIDAGEDITMCSGKVSTVLVNGASSYSWNPAVTFNSPTGAEVIVNPAMTTSYTISGIGENGCKGEGHLLVNVNSLPLIKVEDDKSVCEGSTVNMTASGGITYQWQPANLLENSLGSSVNATPVQTTTYTVTGIDENNCSNNAEITITVNSKPLVKVSSDTTICSDGVAILKAFGAKMYSWEPVDGLDTPYGASVNARPMNSVVYTLTGQGENGCLATATVSVNVDDSNCTTTTAFDHLLTTIELYPNPMSEFIYLNSDVTIEWVDIINIYGVSVYSQKVNATSSVIKPDLETGTYIIRIGGANGIFTAKLVRE